ncbi:hypothetical protein ACQRIT_002382 [Beauveria bassiana]
MLGECKPASQNLFYNNRSESYRPVLTIQLFAQVVGEAVTTWKHYSHTGLFHGGVYSYICNGHESEESEDQPEKDHEAGYQSDVMQE